LLGSGDCKRKGGKLMTPTRVDPYLVGNFRVEIDGVTATSFTEVVGLEAELDVVDYRTGDSPELSVRKLPGLRKYTNITLKRGFTQDASLWDWINNALTGNVVRASVAITLLDQAENPVLVWRLSNAWPCKWTGPTLISKSSEVAIESLEICHEGLELVPVG
jgi:phage tail-like protein